MPETKIRPVGANVLIKPEKKEEKTKSGILLSQTNDHEPPTTGEVVALGTSEEGFSVKVGDKIVFKRYAMDEISVDGIDYLVGTEENILAVYKD